MSLDGFIADTNDQAGPLFDWYNNGNVEVTGHPDFHTSPASAEYLRAAWSSIGADVIGRRLFDLTNGWNGQPAVGDAVFVVTHQPPADWPYPDAPFTFVTDGLHSAIARAQHGTTSRTATTVVAPRMVQADGPTPVRPGGATSVASLFPSAVRTRLSRADVASEPAARAGQRAAERAEITTRVRHIADTSARLRIHR